MAPTSSRSGSAATARHTVLPMRPPAPNTPTRTVIAPEPYRPTPDSGFPREIGRHDARTRRGNRVEGRAGAATLPGDVATRPHQRVPIPFEPLECRCPRLPPPSPPATSPSPPGPAPSSPASTSCSPPAPVSGWSARTGRASPRCCASSPACARPTAAPCAWRRPPRPSATSRRSPTPARARPSAPCWPAARAWPRRRPSSTGPPRP